MYVADPAQAVHTATLGDGWFGDIVVGARREPFFQVDFGTGRTRLKPQPDLAALALLKPYIDGERVQFEMDTGRTTLVFDGKRRGNDAIDGVVTEGGVSGTFRLTHFEVHERGRVDELAGGVYAVEGDAQRQWFVDDGVIFDTKNGNARRLFGVRDGKLLVGASYSVPFPAAGHIDLIHTSDGAKRMVLERDDGSTTTAEAVNVRAETIRFQADGATLEGTLLRPAAQAPYGLIIAVHDRGRVTRDDWWTRAMGHVALAQGFALFTFDKRGNGRSEGEHTGDPSGKTRDPAEVSQANLERLASDVRSAISALAPRRDIDGKRIGLLGRGHAGWVMALAAARDERVKFMLALSAPTVPTGVEAAYSALLDDGEYPTRMTIGQAERILRFPALAPRSGFDPVPTLAKLNIPALFLYGAVDTSTPVAESTRALEPLQRGKNAKDFTVKVLPRAGHLLFEVERDLQTAAPLSPGLAEGVADTLRGWLAEKVAAPAPASEK